MNPSARSARTKTHPSSTSGTAPAKRPLRPDEIAALDRLAREWRTQWRREKAVGGFDFPISKAPARPRNNAGETRHRTRFAEGIARLEFGRSYWDRSVQPSARYPSTPGSSSPPKGGTRREHTVNAAGRRHADSKTH
jgi:hypothetical protein